MSYYIILFDDYVCDSFSTKVVFSRAPSTCPVVTYDIVHTHIHANITLYADANTTIWQILI